jgi:iron complex transport system substrate-binding protein
MRIVSLLPSATEILFALGLGESVVGVTFECDHPVDARSRRIVSTSALPEGLSPGEIDAVVKERVTAGEDLYRLDRGAFAEIDPTLVVTQDLCAVCAVDVSEVDDALAYLACVADVITLDPMTLREVIESIQTVGDATGTRSRADAIVTDLDQRLSAVAQKVTGAPTPDVVVLEWTEPAFTAGHWVPDLVTAAGGRSMLSNAGAHSVGVEWDAIAHCGADIVVAAPCGYRLDGAADLVAPLIGANRLPLEAQVWAVDADHHVVRPGPRVVDGVEVLASIFHPERAGAPDPRHARRLR